MRVPRIPPRTCASAISYGKGARHPFPPAHGGLWNRSRETSRDTASAPAPKQRETDPPPCTGQSAREKKAQDDLAEDTSLPSGGSGAATRPPNDGRDESCHSMVMVDPLNASDWTAFPSKELCRTRMDAGPKIGFLV